MLVPVCSATAPAEPVDVDPAPDRRLLRRLRADRLAAPPGQPQRPADDGHRLRVPRSPRCSATTTRCVAQTVASWLSDLWTLFFVPLLLTYLQRRPAAHPGGPGTGRRRRGRDRAARPALAGLRRRPRPHCCSRSPTREVADGDRHACSARSTSRSPSARRPWSPRAGGPHPRRAGGRCCRASPARFACCSRRRCSASTSSSAAAAGDPALDRGLLDRAGAARLPRRAAALAAGPRRPGRPVRRARDDAARRAAGGAGAGCCTTRRSRSPTPARTGGFVDVDGRRSSFPTRRGPSGRSRAWQRDGAPVAALVYDRSLDDDPELVEAVGGAATIALENRLLQAAVRRPARRVAGVAAAARHRGRRRAPSDRAQPARRRPAAAGHAGPAALADPAPHPRRPGRRRAARRQRERRARAVARRAARARTGNPSGRARARTGARTGGAGPALARAGQARLRAGARPPRPVEFAAYFVASEALANVAKYAQASGVTVRVTRSDDRRRHRDRRRRRRRGRSRCRLGPARPRGPGGGPRRSALGVEPARWRHGRGRGTARALSRTYVRESCVPARGSCASARRSRRSRTMIQPPSAATASPIGVP